MRALFPLFMGQNAGAIKDIKPARQIVEEMVDEARPAFEWLPD